MGASAEARRREARLETLHLGQDFLAHTVTVDIHAHPGRFFLDGAPDTPFTRMCGEPDVASALSDMESGQVSVAVFAIVADHVLLEPGPRGLRASRAFQPHEAYLEFERQVQCLHDLEKTGLVQVVSGENSRGAAPTARPVNPRGIERGKPPPMRAVLSVEGGDFIEDRLERIAKARAAGVQSITIMHYTTNQIGDTQTEAATHGGLTTLGTEILAEIEAQNIVVDLAHASFATTESAARQATRPMVISHSNVRRTGQGHPRLISLEHAQLVTEGGGVIGAVPAGFDQSSLHDFVDTVFYMVEKLGASHVAIGTDMDYTFKPVLNGYQQWPLLAGLLLERGLGEDELTRVMGDNWWRVAGNEVDSPLHPTDTR